MLGVPGLMNVYRSGGVTIARRPGAGVADDKAIYTYVPEMVRFYLGEEPILNNVPTWQCARPEDRAYVLEHLPELVVKEVHGSGGYGMLVGPKADQRRDRRVPPTRSSEPRRTTSPSRRWRCPPARPSSRRASRPRHVDLRPYCLVGEQIELVPGGLTRVALTRGQPGRRTRRQGGGVKDTWVLAD